MPVGRPRVAISVVSHGDRRPLEVLLGTLARWEAGPALQLVVTDNLGHDLPELDPLPWASITLLRNPHPVGFARNHNVAFTHCQAEYFCVLNPDVRLIQPILEPLLETLGGGQVAIAAPLIQDEAGRIQDSFRALPSPGVIMARRLLPPRPVGTLPPGPSVLTVDWLAGIFLLFHRETFARLHGFDARYRLYFEDVDLCTRARLLGLASGVDTRVRIVHEGKRASRQPGKYLLWHVQSSLRFFTSPVYWRAKRLARLQALPGPGS